MIKSWGIKEGDWGIVGGGNLPIFFSTILPELLIESGHAIEVSLRRSMQLIKTKDVDCMQTGMRLMHVVSKKEAEVLPDDCSREVFTVLVDEKIRSQISFRLVYSASFKFFYNQALEILDSLMQQGKDGDLILQSALPMLNSKHSDIKADGQKIMELIAKNQHHYSLEFQEKIMKTLQKSNSDASQDSLSENPLKIHVKKP